MDESRDDEQRKPKDEPKQKQSDEEPGAGLTSPPRAPHCSMLRNWVSWLAFALSFIAAVIISAVSKYVPLLRPQGFYCQDPELSHKYTGEIISTPIIIIAAFVITPIILAVVEHWGKTGARTRWERTEQFVLWYRDFVTGLVILISTTAVIKVLFGEPRPHFFDSCKPKEANNCTAGTYINHFECTSQQKEEFRDASKSFPSGHAAIAFYSFFYISWYLQRNLNKVLSIILLWIQTVLFITACFVSLSRITDHRHHWWDVLVGIILGSAIAVCSVLTLSKNFQTQGALISK